MEQGNFLVTPSCVVRGELYKKLMPFDADRFGVNTDFNVWLRLLEESPVAIIEEELIRYRISSKSGSYQYRFSHTDEADFFKVIGHHISINSEVLNIPKNTLAKYEFLRSLNRISRAVNCLVKNQPDEAKNLLKQSAIGVSFPATVNSIKKLKHLAYWFFGILLLGMVYLSLGHYRGNGLHCLLYNKGSKVV